MMPEATADPYVAADRAAFAAPLTGTELADRLHKPESSELTEGDNSLKM